jgi:tetratricopeptide (TPR) repeat protein
LARAGERRNGHPATPSDLSLGEFDRRPRAVPDVRQESLDEREWDDRVAREVRHQEVIEASFDRAEAYARMGEFEQALEWLDRAATLSGGLPPAYRAQRARWALSTAVRLRPTGGYQDADSGELQGHR